MQPCLLLALALLGTASASHPAPASPEAEEVVLEVPEDEDTRCPLESEAQVFSIHDPLSATTYRYVVVTRCQTFRRAQRTCSRCYHGRLASVHSYRINARLKRRARRCTNRSRVWIGAVTRRVMGTGEA
ncbi:bone marrow proteoglycan isoform 1-T1 [Theristicus caerulescens]